MITIRFPVLPLLAYASNNGKIGPVATSSSHHLVHPVVSQAVSQLGCRDRQTDQGRPGIGTPATSTGTWAISVGTSAGATVITAGAAGPWTVATSPFAAGGTAAFSGTLSGNAPFTANINFSGAAFVTLPGPADWGNGPNGVQVVTYGGQSNGHIGAPGNPLYANDNNLVPGLAAAVEPSSTAQTARRSATGSC